MRNLWDKMLATATDAGQFVEEVTRNGIRFVQSTVGKIPLFTSTTAEESDPDLERDETHYLLVPFRGDPCGYALYTRRSLPSGTGPTNSLPKARVFHLHDPAGVSDLEKLLVHSVKSRALAERADEKTLGDHLEELGEQIDRESFKVTGGLLIIGGAVAFVNPLIGAGIAAKALLPSLGAKASRLGLSMAGGKLREMATGRTDRKAEKEAVAEVKRLKPEVYLNPLLQQLEEAVSTDATSHDPLIESADLVRDFPSTRYLRITTEAILSVYEESLDRKRLPETLGLHERDLAWFTHLRDLRDTLRSA